MVDLKRIQVLTFVIGIIGSLAFWIFRGPQDAGGFLTGAAFSLVGLRSWRRLAEAATTGQKTRGATASGVFLSLRYALLAGAIYVIVNVLGISPAAMVLGLLASFVAVVLELLLRSISSK